MKAILILCGDPEAGARLPSWLRSRFAQKFNSVEEFLHGGLSILTPDTVLVPIGPKSLSAVRMIRRFPQTALCCVAAPGGTQVPGVDVDLVDEDQLVTRAEEIRKAVESFEPVEMSGDLGDLSVFLFLRFLLSRGIMSLDAQRDLASPYGHSYPLCGIFFNDALESWPNDLAKLNFFTRRFHDLLHVCPHCDRYNLNYREVCPECSSANLGPGEVLHHFRCGEVIAEGQFQKGEDFICPKCNQKLRHLGVDYDRPSEYYSCRACSGVFVEPINDASCLSCGKRSKLGELREHAIYHYVLTEEGRRAARQGLYPASSAQSLFDRELGGLHSPEFFQEFSRIEMRRRKRYGGSISVLALHFEFEEKSVSIKQLHQVVWKVARMLRENLRDSDVMARLTDKLYLSVLTDTPPEGAKVVASRLEKAANESVESLGIQFKVRDVTGTYFEMVEKGQFESREILRSIQASPQTGGKESQA